MQEIDVATAEYSTFKVNDNYSLVDTCQILYEQTQALLEAVGEWQAFLKSPGEFSNCNSSIYPKTELELGLFRFAQAIKKEVNYLKHLLQNEGLIQPQHVNGSNFPFLEAVYHCARREKGLVTIFKPVRVINKKENDGMDETSSTLTWDKLRIDVVSNDGLKWIKVSARNARGLIGQDFLFNHDSIGTDNIPLQNKARLMLLTASQNQVHFKIPRICFQFSCFNVERTHTGLVLNSVFGLLSDMGILIEEVPILSFPGLLPGGEWRYDPMRVATPSLSLDVTTLLAICSQLTHLGDSCQLSHKANESLYIQLEQEKS